MKYHLAWFVCSILSTHCVGQFAVQKLVPSKLPAKVTYSGKMVNGVSWIDSLGINYVVATETGEYVVKDSDGYDSRSADLFVYHYVVRQQQPTRIWKIHDYSADCGLDLRVAFIEGAFRITDLDKDGIAEVWVMYENQCTGDISPPPAKIIMYEHTTKYVLRGERLVWISKSEQYGGHYTLDRSFKEGFSGFRKYACDLWAAHKRVRR